MRSSSRSLLSAASLLLSLATLACSGAGETSPKLSRKVAATKLGADSLWGDKWTEFMLPEKRRSRCAPLANTYLGKLQTDGLVTLTESLEGWQGWTCTAEATAKARQLPSGKLSETKTDAVFNEPTPGIAILSFRTVRPEFTEVTGILQDDGSAEARAEFTFRRRSTTNSRYFNGVLDTTAVAKGAALFRRFDDGWRLISFMSAD